MENLNVNSPSVSTAVCCRCHEVRNLDEFPRDRSRKAGISPRCKWCVKEYHRACKDRTNELARERRARDPERVRATALRCYYAHREEYKEKGREYYRSHREEHARHHLDWRTKNPERFRQSVREYQQRNPEMGRTLRKNRRARLRGAEGKFTAKEWVDLKEHYGHKCLACVRAEPEIVLTVDHVLPLSLGGTNSIDNIQPLCFSCNSHKQARFVDYRT